MDIDGSPAPNLFAGIDNLINDRLGVTDYRTKTATLELVARASTIDGEEFVNALFEGLRQNWLRALPAAKASNENFRWRFPQLALADQNKSPEVTLERKLIRACENAGRDDWSNQVPVLSGIVGSHAYKRQAIDLVHKISDGFEFVELKVETNTPLYAAIEILTYGMFWLLSRQSRIHPNYPDNPILNASTLWLSTLAPAQFYTGLTSSEFSNTLDSGVSALGRRNGVVMRFRHMAFSEGFRWPAEVSDTELLNWLDGRKLVEPCVDDKLFLPGLPVELIRAAYLNAPGNEIESGKFANPESSAALVANAFGLFFENPAALPALPGTLDCGWPAESVTPEAIVRFPWAGGRHPCLDVLIVTSSSLIGVESKRYEPFRSKDDREMSEAYWRPIWGTEMTGYQRCRDGLRDGSRRFERLDAAQLVKHAFALRTAVHNVPAWAGKRPVLLYLYAEPERWPGDKGPVSIEVRMQHRAEVAAFSGMVMGDEVSFHSCSYSELLAAWKAQSDPLISAHAAAVVKRFLS